MRNPHNRLKIWLGKTWLKLNGWRLEGELPAARQFVMIGAPHTTNWDLAYMLAISYALGFKPFWLGKQSLFRGPMGPLMRWTGGVAIDRSKHANVVDQIVARFAQSPDFILAVSPEGTRGSISRWKTGFYHMALGAKVPIQLGFLDYKRKVGGLGLQLIPSGDIAKDFEIIRAFYTPISGRYPEQFDPAAIQVSNA